MALSFNCFAWLSGRILLRLLEKLDFNKPHPLFSTSLPTDNCPRNEQAEVGSSETLCHGQDALSKVNKRQILLRVNEKSVQKSGLWN